MSESTLSQITTVIPTYRRPRLLRRAIVSALQQEPVSVRVRVCDNASGDDTGKIVAALTQLHPQIEYHCHSQNIGSGANFEFGVRNIETPFFSLLSDDDYLLPGFYQRALTALNAHPQAMFWVGITLNVDPEGVIWDARVERWLRDGVFFPPEGALAMTAGLAPAWTGIVFRREVLEQVGFLDPEALSPGDLDYTLRLAARYSYVVEKYPSAVFTLNTQSASATQPLSSFWPGWQKMFRNIEALDMLSVSDRDRLLAALHADARRMLFRRGGNALASGRYEFARDAALALDRDYSKTSRANVLRALAVVCERVPVAQRVLTLIYRAIERRMVRSRQGLRARYGHLLQP
ncbi:Glycosyl transferase family 2 [Dyella sp. OK004]|uniref:glycosyltransferase family 2 protein n=1 Tax=Dyella sp. OK004 TaxID=1855292 RepID=UPI0008F2DBF5|nr:glycosyltransferase family A protein [Dyella sp. OK004]SFS05948.1 Glycosyl transferase family 2 [Dyella sp. OK004]